MVALLIISAFIIQFLILFLFKEANTIKRAFINIIINTCILIITLSFIENHDTKGAIVIICVFSYFFSGILIYFGLISNTESQANNAIPDQTNKTNRNYAKAYPSKLFPDYPIRPQNIFILDEPIWDQSLANISMIGLCITNEFQVWKNSVGNYKWPSYANEELSALINAYHQMQAKVPNGITHTVNVQEVRKLAMSYINLLRNDDVLYSEFMAGQITLFNLSLDFANTIACGGTLQTSLEWYG